MDKLKAAVKIVINKNLAINPGERVLIVTDKDKKKIADLFYKEISKITKCKIIGYPVMKYHGQEPPKRVALEMLRNDVELLITTKSLTHTKARKEANKNSRIASMPDITLDMIKRALNIDYDEMQRKNKVIGDLLDRGKKIRVISEIGTDIGFSIKGRLAHSRKDGIYTEKGKYGNLPAGEIFIAPLEDSANGIYFVDCSIGGIGKVDKIVKMVFRDGKVIEVNGGKAAEKLNKIINLAGEKSRIIAEFGIGTNDKARITGNLLEDEKVLGTCHIATGNNTGFGGKNEVEFHVDYVINKPTIFIDKKMIMERGKLLI